MAGRPSKIKDKNLTNSFNQPQEKKAMYLTRTLSKRILLQKFCWATKTCHATISFYWLKQMDDSHCHYTQSNSKSKISIWTIIILYHDRLLIELTLNGPLLNHNEIKFLFINVFKRWERQKKNKIKFRFSFHSIWKLKTTLSICQNEK